MFFLYWNQEVLLGMSHFTAQKLLCVRAGLFREILRQQYFKITIYFGRNLSIHLGQLRFTILTPI